MFLRHSKGDGRFRYETKKVVFYMYPLRMAASALRIDDPAAPMTATRKGKGISFLFAPIEGRREREREKEKE